MEISNDSPASSPRPAGVGPGERLQAARIEKGLSVQDVANRMHLSSNILESIEENNFDEITAPIFVKGYLRAYARIVSLDEDEMIQQYINFYSEEDPPITSTSNMAPELSVADARIKWTTYLVILVLAALLAVWWWNKERNQEVAISLEASPDTTEQVIEEGTQPVQPASSEIEAGSESTISESTIGTASNESDSAETVEPDSETVATDSIVEAEPESEVEPENAVNDAVDEIQPDEEVMVEAESEASESSVTSAAEVFVGSHTAPAGSDLLKIIVHADTWADIKDNSDYQLVYDLLRAGQSVNLTGQAPFTVFLGNGHGVEISFNNQEIGLTSLIQDDNTARLNVGQ